MINNIILIIIQILLFLNVYDAVCIILDITLHLTILSLNIKLEYLHFIIIIICKY